MLRARSLRHWALVCLVFTGLGCTLITEVDRTKIPTDGGGGGGGEAPADDDREE